MSNEKNNGRLRGKTTIVTGIGQGCTLIFAREGANVFVFKKIVKVLLKQKNTVKPKKY